MADQKFIDSEINKISKRFGIAIEQVSEALRKLLRGKTTAQKVAIFNELNVTELIKAKTSGILADYSSANARILLSKELFADVTEETLSALLVQSEQYLAGEISAMSNVLKQEVLSGAINGLGTKEIVDNISKKGYGASIGMKRIVTDGLNNYSRAVTRVMMEEAPDDTKYIYIRPADEKTRPFCLSAIQAGAITMEQIQSMGWGYSLSGGGGINCRHGWEPVSRDVRGQCYQKEEAEEILNA